MRGYQIAAHRPLVLLSLALLLYVHAAQEMPPLWTLVALIALSAVAMFQRHLFAAAFVLVVLIALWESFKFAVFVLLAAPWALALTVLCAATLTLARPRRPLGAPELIGWATLFVGLIVWTAPTLDSRPPWVAWSAAAGFVLIGALYAVLGRAGLMRMLIGLCGLAVALSIGSQVWEVSRPRSGPGFRWLDVPLKQITFAIPIEGNRYLLAPHFHQALAYLVDGSGKILANYESARESSSTYQVLQTEQGPRYLLGLGPELFAFDPTSQQLESLLVFNETDAQGYLHLDQPGRRLVSTFDNGDARLINIDSWEITSLLPGEQQGFVRMTDDIAPLPASEDLVRLDWHHMFFGRLTRWNPQTGEIKAQRPLFPVAGFINLDVVGDPPLLLAILTVPGKLLVLDPQTLATVREIDLDMGIRKGAYDPQRGLYYLINYFNGELYAVDPAKGELVATVRTGLRRCRLPAVDLAAQRLTVANHYKLLVIDLDQWLPIAD
ncbi:MAG: hypothetical protein P9M14_15065 [Candidatus Alcyoniella australis]|nr:hypothetical protein [Candidatus Alcyoniella australis]